MCAKLSLKQWTFYIDSSPSAPVTLARWLGDRLGLPTGADELVVSRTVVLNPAVVLAAVDGVVDGLKFQVLNHLLGQCMMSTFQHMVLGFTLFSFAWNFCFPKHLARYLKSEEALAKHRRELDETQSKAIDRFWGTFRRSFVLSSELMWAICNYQEKVPDLVFGFIKPLLEPLVKEEEKQMHGRLASISEGGALRISHGSMAQCGRCGRGVLFRARLVNGVLACSPCLRSHKNRGVAYPVIPLYGACSVYALYE